MEKNTVLLQDTEAFMRGELDNVTVQQNSVVLDLVQGSYVPYGCYTSAPLPMPLFDALRVDPNYLYRGSFREEARALTREEQDLLEAYRSLPPLGRETVKDLTRSLCALCSAQETER